MGTLWVVLPVRTDAGEIQPVQPVVEYLEPNYEQAEELYYSWQLTQRAKKLVGSHQGQCVAFVRKFLHTNEVASLAKNTTANTEIPKAGEIIITNESKYGHVGAVLETSTTEVTFAESNAPLGSERMGIRTLQLTDPRIVGYREVGE